MTRYAQSEAEWLSVFGDNLASFLRDYNMTQRELADLSGLSESAISHYVHKEKMPGIKAIVNIAHALNVDVDELVDFGYFII